MKSPLHCQLRCFAVGIAFLAAGETWAATGTALDDVFAITSRSGQFVVLGNRLSGGLPNSARVAQLAAANKVELDPNLTAVSCERVRGALIRRLGLSESWKGKIYVSLVDRTRADTKAQITSKRFRDAWQYRLDLLNPADDESFAFAVIQVLLQERVDRTSEDHSAQIPLWLVTGLSREILAREPDLLVRMQMPVNRVTKLGDPVQEPRKIFRQRPALSFDEMSWPAPELFEGERQAIFGSSAHLLVDSLLRLPDGPNMMRRFIAELPNYLNWQIAFLRGFDKKFKTLLDVEKWWAVNLAGFTGRNQWQMWSAEKALDGLAEVLRVDVEVRADAKAVPSKSTVTLQTVLRDWDYTRQQSALQIVRVQLAQLRMNMPPELLRTLDAYLAVLNTYLAKRPVSGFSPVRGQAVTTGNQLARAAIRELDGLDGERENLRVAIDHAKTSASARP